MQFIIDSYNENIQIKNNNYTVKVVGCNENYIKRYDKKNILYCVKPICEESCPVSKNAVCMPSENNTYNYPYLNYCKCSSGYEGELCDNKIYIDFR